MSFALYLIGFIIFVAGVAWALSVAGVSTTYIAIAVVILVGLGIFTGVTRTRAKDPAV
jgi:membrane-bound acyltransferase YfiQ involved in biofilm formation